MAKASFEYVFSAVDVLLTLIQLSPGLYPNIKTIFPRYGDSHVKHKTALRPSYLYHGDPYTDKSVSFFWDRSQV